MRAQTRTVRGRVIAPPRRYTPATPSPSLSEQANRSTTMPSAVNRGQRRKLCTESNVARGPLASVESQMNFDFDGDIDEDYDESVAQPPKKTPRLYARSNSAEENDDNDNYQQDMPERVEEISENDGRQPAAQERLNVDNGNVTQSGNCSRSSNTNDNMYQLIRNEINNVYTKLSYTLNSNMNTIEKRVNKLAAVCIATKETSIEKFKSSTGNGFETTVDFDGFNLLDIYGKNHADYARQVLRKLYTTKELCSSRLPSSATHYSRKSLEATRFKKLNDAIRNKYRIHQDKYDEFFRCCLRRKLVDFLCDERKRAIKERQVQFFKEHGEQISTDLRADSNCEIITMINE